MTLTPATFRTGPRRANRAVRRWLGAIVLVATAAVVGLPSLASAHSLDSTTISMRVYEDSADATVTVAIDTLDAALGTDFADQDLSAFGGEAIAYLEDHLTVTGADGVVWDEAWSNPERQSTEGIDSFSADVQFDTSTSTTSSFTVDYDAVIEADPTHQAVIVLTDSSGEISTAGIATGTDTAVTIVDRQNSVPVGDMIHLGFAHVLEGADHLLFLLTLLLPAPMIAVAGTWRRAEPLVPTVRRVFHVVTAFTLGHSITLIASAFGVVSVPSRPVEVIIAASVAVSAIHAIKPLALDVITLRARRGEEMIAGVFGLIHGLAFAGILTSLGLEGKTTVMSLLAFNIGIEVAQIAATALVFPSVYLLARTRYGNAFRTTTALVALSAALAWALERLDLITNPLAGIETAAIAHPWWIVIGLAGVAVIASAVEQLGSSDVTLTPVASLSIDTGAG